MNGFENIKERIELREKFRKETGDNWENSQGEPDIDYVLWLESKLFAIPVVVGRSEQLVCDDCGSKNVRDTDYGKQCGNCFKYL